MMIRSTNDICFVSVKHSHDEEWVTYFNVDIAPIIFEIKESSWCGDYPHNFLNVFGDHTK